MTLRRIRDRAVLWLLARMCLSPRIMVIVKMQGGQHIEKGVRMLSPVMIIRVPKLQRGSCRNIIHGTAAEGSEYWPGIRSKAGDLFSYEDEQGRDVELSTDVMTPERLEELRKRFIEIGEAETAKKLEKP